jgi:hypothetical protein
VGVRLDETKPPRKFAVGRSGQVEISDCGRVHLLPDEMVTFVTPSGKEYDVAAKDWGFYATPSVNGRLKDQGFKTALVRNSQGRYYVMLVEAEGTDKFLKYLRDEQQELCEWLDERD